MAIEGVHVIEHPVLAHHLAALRNKDTDPARFRAVLAGMSRMLAYEATRDVPTRAVAVQTPMEKMEGARELSGRPLVVSIMRAGNGMLGGVLELLPFAEVGHIGIYRDRFIRSTVEYYFRLPDDVEGKTVFLLDPLLATGDTASAAIRRIREQGTGPVRMLCVLASRQGIERVREAAPDTRIFCASIERDLDDRGFLLPGIGDAGDRLYGTVR